MTNGKLNIQWKEVALQLDAQLRKLHEEIGAQIVKNTFEYGLVQEEQFYADHQNNEDDEDG